LSCSRRRRILAAALSFAAVLAANRSVRAGGDALREPRLFVRLAAGPAFDVESWTPSGPSTGASTKGWAPVLDVAVGRRIRPRLAIAGDLQLASVIDRTQSYRGGSYALADTLHLLDAVSVVVDYRLWRYPWLYVGGGPGLLFASDIDTQFGATATNLGGTLTAYAGYRRYVGRGWNMGVIAKLTLYGFASSSPPPSSVSIGLLSLVLVSFGR
jgi:hypothetical protein